MCQLDPEIMSSNDGILGKEWHIKAEGPEDCLLIIKVLNWIHQHDRVTVRTIRSRYVELNVTEAGIGTGTRPAECTIKAAIARDDVRNALKLIKELKKQQNLEITIVELNFHEFEINDPVFTELLLDTLKFNKDMRSITISKCNLPCSVSEHIKRQLHTCNKLELIDFRSSPCMIASLGNTMTSLEMLNLEKCIVTHEVADQLAETLLHCYNLKSLHLGFSKITGLIEKIFDQDSVLSFHLLQELDLTHAVLSKADISSLFQAAGGGKLSQLKTLGLSGIIQAVCIADLLGTNGYPKFTALENLDLSETNLNRKDPLGLSAAVQHGQLPKLRYLSFTVNDTEEMEDAMIDFFDNCEEQDGETIYVYVFYDS